MDFMKGIDNQSATTDDEVYALATNVWNEVSSTTTTKEDMIFLFVQYLELISVRVKGFHLK